MRVKVFDETFLRFFEQTEEPERLLDFAIGIGSFEHIAKILVANAGDADMVQSLRQFLDLRHSMSME